ncbi:MAG: glutamate racemase [Thermostichales cyanobacterium SZTDM-1c_bins_54]
MARDPFAAAPEGAMVKGNLWCVAGMDRPIGLFDSGVGGLTVWQALRQQLPAERLIYVGDTARVPYGDRSQTEIVTFVQEIIAWMQAQGVKLIAMACNTSSAWALEVVQPLCPVPLLGIIVPGAQAACRQGSRIGVVATQATVSSGAYGRAIQELGGQCWQVACPELVPLIEAGERATPRVRAVVQGCVQPLLRQGIDTLVYGCTHYPWLDPLFAAALPAHVRRIDPAVALAEAVARELDLWGWRRKGPELAQPTQFYCSGDPESFARRAAVWLGFRPQVRQVCWAALAEAKSES